MHVGIFAKTFNRPRLEETLDAVRAAGASSVQFNMSCTGLSAMPTPCKLSTRINGAHRLTDHPRHW